MNVPTVLTPVEEITNQKQNNKVAIILVTTLFFLWGFAHNLDPILIPHLKKSFTLTTMEATLVDSAVFAAYLLFALPAGFIIKKAGYKKGIITGLCIFAAGCYLFVPAANIQSYTFFLLALFIIACGLTTLETAANPYISIIGNPATATQRLNMAQSFNGLAAALAPVIGSRLILTKGYTDEQLANMTNEVRKIALASEASSVKTPYIVLGSILILIAIVFAFINLPEMKVAAIHQQNSKHVFHALRHKHLAWGAIAQFFYVGAQICVFSLFILYATRSASLSEVRASDYLGACGIAFLIGRFAGTLLMKYVKPQYLLAIYALINIVLCLVAALASGITTVYAVISICFFMSIMFPTIFALSINGLENDTEYGSSLLIMSVVGGAIIPRLFGYISDVTGNIQYGYFVPLFCFAVIVFFGWTGHKVSLKDVKTSPSNLI
jgi:FHS family L-fucose permease-like MFS transporter